MTYALCDVLLLLESVLSSHECFVAVDGEEDYLSLYINKFGKPLLALFCCGQMSQQNYYQNAYVFSLCDRFYG